LQKHIGAYGKTRDVYAAYRASGYSKKYYVEHEQILDKFFQKYIDAPVNMVYYTNSDASVNYDFGCGKGEQHAKS
jgi:hypothetical protein